MGRRIDPVGRVVDTLASMYGWSIEYILDQPYTKLRELLNSIKFREYLESMKLFRLINLAQGGNQHQVEEFFGHLKPKITEIKKTTPVPVEPLPRFEPMSLEGFNFICKD